MLFMEFSTGVLLWSNPKNNEVVASAATWYTYTKPSFPHKRITLSTVQKNILAPVIIHQYTAQKAVDAVCNRTIEKLLVSKLIQLHHPLNITLILKTPPTDTYILPYKVCNTHWLLNAANALLKGHIE